MEPVECFSIDFTGALDFHEHIKTLTLTDDWNHPTDVGATDAVFGLHFAIGSLVATGSPDVPIFDLKVGWHDIVDVNVLQRCVTVVLEQDEHFIAAFAANRHRLLSCGEIPSVVHDADDWCVLCIPATTWSRLFSTELTMGRCADCSVFGGWVRCEKVVLNRQ